MELDREHIEKAMDWLDSLVGNSLEGEMAMKTYQLLGILYDTCEELTEENKKIGVENFDLICELSRIKADTVRKMQERLKQYENRHITTPCNFCKHSFKGNRNKRCDDDLRCFGFNKWESVIDQIAEEMIGGKDVNKEN